MKTSSPGPCKGLILIQDGIGDRPIKAFEYSTPLEAVATPSMDALICGGIAGQMDICEPGMRVGTDVGHRPLFDQKVDDRVHMRGPMEAVGEGISLRPGDMALRCNFATVDGNFRVVDRRTGRIRGEALELANSLIRSIRIMGW